MEYGYLGEVVPVAVVGFLIMLAFIVGLITVVTIRTGWSSRTGWLPPEVYQAPQRRTRQDVRTHS